ncbi:acetyl-CoA acetyltransferase [Endozoicomonas sp. OPT23]|uniref:acetyl-CoA acetyltransferase n=1 Tax=Endozoicomonas sp. OPT23 TaxID=2072845 RepID=UPI00129B382C|nr:acetyl-CoA acetyltransferase [Endozoicomonas sp. OPT23]MRI31463.1 acetyl-CoA acetyltransferase [Endozoicomonas sp. OPT23]
MKELDPNTPVLVGVGVIDQRTDSPAEAKEAWQLMADAVTASAKDAGAESLLADIDLISVPQGMWQYTDPARLVADSVGAAKATTVFAEIGILQQTIMGDACERISKGEIDVAVVTGGEAKYRELMAKITKTEINNTQQQTTPDVTFKPDAELWLKEESNAGLAMPVGFYAVMESAFRHSKGLSIEEHRDRLAKMYSRFSDIAADNPYAWKPMHVDTDYIKEASEKNPMLAFPYTKLHNTSWNVDQAGALLFTSVAKAKALGIPEEKWVFPVASTESNAMNCVSQRKELHRLPGARLCGEKALEHAGIKAEDVGLLDLYSCFPIAVEAYANELGLDLNRDLTITGGMPFAGGPLNNYVIQSTCRMVQLLRNGSDEYALVSSVSGMMTKQAYGLWARKPSEKGFANIDVSSDVKAEVSPVELDCTYKGEGVIAGYTVLYKGVEKSRAIAVIDQPDGKRSVCFNESADVMTQMEQQEFCGQKVAVSATQFSLI